jgi:hypothetical protein
MQICLELLKPGQRFRLACDPAVRGTFVECTGASAKVQIDGGTRDVVIEEKNGETRSFRAHRTKTTTWSPGTMVERIQTPVADPAPAPTEARAQPPQEVDVSKTKHRTKKTTRKPPSPKATAKGEAVALKTKKAKAEANGKMSCLDAAAKVLAEATTPLNTADMIARMAEKGYWTSPGGKTPAATLYSAILREIDKKGKDARFKKSDRGMFAITA